MRRLPLANLGATSSQAHLPFRLSYKLIHRLEIYDRTPTSGFRPSTLSPNLQTPNPMLCAIITRSIPGSMHPPQNLLIGHIYWSFGSKLLINSHDERFMAYSTTRAIRRPPSLVLLHTHHHDDAWAYQRYSQRPNSKNLGSTISPSQNLNHHPKPHPAEIKTHT